MSPRGEIMSPRGGIMSPRGGIMSPRVGIMSPRGEITCSTAASMGLSNMKVSSKVSGGTISTTT
eukprot:7495523-Pyramimonas_sp.AAC.1